MSMSDPIADLLTRIRNASRAEHEKVDIPSSKLKVRITEILKEEGFIKNFRLIEDKKQGMLRVYLKYGPGNEKIISGLVRVSKPGRRVYVAKDKIPSILGGMGVAILSTSQGVMTDRAVRKQQLGGEVLAISAVTGKGIPALVHRISAVLEQVPDSFEAGSEPAGAALTLLILGKAQ